MSRTTITPWTDELFDTREADFASLVEQGVQDMVDATLLALREDGALTAAAQKPPPQEPASGPIPPGVQAAALGAWGIQVETELYPAVQDVFAEGGERVVEALAEVFSFPPDTIPPVGNAYADEYLQHARNRMVGVGENIWKGIKGELEAGLAAGDGIPELAVRLQNYASLSESRARTVARTEVLSSANAGSYLQMVEAGLDDVTKEWLATDDHRTRISHVHADDQAVPLLAEFQVEVYQAGALQGTEPMEFPGDPIATPANVINCRCSMSFSFDDEDGPAGVLTAAGKFLESEHPRDSKGKFMNKLEIALLNAKDKKAAYDKLSSAEKAKVGKATKDAAGVTNNTPQKDKDSGPVHGGLDKKTGKKAPAGKPVFLRVKTLFETDYEDGAIVAVRPESNERVVWDAGKKRMLLQKDGKTTDTLTRGALMKLRKDEDGWSTPSAGVQDEMAPAVTTPPDLLPGQKPVFLRTQVVYSTKYEDGELVAVHPGDDLEVRWDASSKRMLVQRDGETQETLTRGALMSKYKDADGWFSPPATTPEPDDEPDTDVPSGPASEITPVVDETPPAPAPQPAPAKKKKARKLYVEYNGVVHTRTTANDYKFVSIVNFPWLNDKGGVYSWHTTEALAAKSTLTGSQKAHGAKVIAIIPVSDQPITPGVIPTAHVPDSPQADVPVPADTSPVTVAGGIPAAGSLTSTGKVVGSNGATIYRDNSTGREWLFKPSPAGMGTFMADVDVATARLREVLGLPTPTTGKITIDGRSGSIQQMYEGATDPFGYNFKPQDLTDADKLAIQKEHIFDWLVGNHAGDVGNYVRLPGGELVGVGKGQAFKFFGSDDLDPHFSPNPAMPAANLLMQAYANGEGGGAAIFGVNHPEIKKLLKKVDDLFNSDYREILRPYAVNAAKYQMLAKGGPKYLGLTDPAFPANDVEAFLDFAEDRKMTLREDFQVLYADLAKQRKAKIAALHDDSLPLEEFVPTPAIVTQAAADGVPVEMNAATLNKAGYSHGQVIGINKKWNERVVWNDTSKKFEHQIGGPKWITVESLSKSAAVKYFPQQILNTWTKPGPGETHADMPQPLPKIAGQKKTGTEVPAPEVSAPPFAVADFTSQDASLPEVPDYLLSGLLDRFTPSSLPSPSSADGGDLFFRLLQLQNSLAKDSGVHASLLGLAKHLDKARANRGFLVTPGTRIEDKVATYLSGPDGQQEAGNLVQSFSEGVADAQADARTQAEVQAIKISRPSKASAKASGVKFGNMPVTTALAFFADVRSTLSQQDRDAIAAYTSTTFRQINAAMRGRNPYNEPHNGSPGDFIPAGRIQRNMRPLPQDTLLHRGVGQSALGFSPENPMSLEKLQAMIGQSFVDEGFFSTSLDRDKAFTYNPLKFIVEAPKGTAAIYVAPISENSQEHEMLLAAGTKFKIISVEKAPISGGTSAFNVTLRVIQ